MSEVSEIRSDAGSATDDEWPSGLVDLYRTERLGLVRLAYLLVHRQEVAEEIVQDAFIAARPAWTGVQDPIRYLRRAVVNRCRSWGRHQQVVMAHSPPPPEPTDLAADELWDALGRLDERRRAAIVLRFYGGLPHKEIAEILGCRPTTVRTSIHRGLAQLGKEIER